MEKFKNNPKELKDIQFNFIMDLKTRKALEEIMGFSAMSGCAVIRRLILKELKNKTLEI
jgi:hypothetical protein